MPEKKAGAGASKHRAQIIPFHSLSVGACPSLSIVGSIQERRSFEFFRFQTGNEIAIALGLTVTHQLILQASHSDQAVKSAAIALGSIGERLQINSVLTEDSEQANACHDFANVQYCNALEHLGKKMSSNPDLSVDLAILICILFTLFEFLRGNDSGALVHLRSGLNILRRSTASSPGSAELRPSNSDLLRQEFIRVFSLMDMQSVLWLGLDSFQSPALMPLDLPPTPTTLYSFSTVDEAGVSLNYHISQIVNFRRSIPIQDHLSLLDQIPPAASVQAQQLLAGLERLPSAFDALVEKLGSGLNDENLQRITVMRMNCKINMIIFHARLHQVEDYILDLCDSDFYQIISNARSVIRPMNELTKIRIQRIVQPNNAGINPSPMFSFFNGIIAPLYYTAIKCRNPRICWDAISLLLDSPWREGAWDSATMARIAKRRLARLEEAGSNSEGLSEVSSSSGWTCSSEARSDSHSARGKPGEVSSSGQKTLNDRS